MHVLVLGMLFLACSAQAADPLEAGRTAFRRCANCHQVGPNAHNNFGPHLNGIVGRRAGTLPGFAYSPAMKKAGFVWDEQRLAAFLDDPDKLVPGTRMRFWGLMGDRQARELIIYLRSFPPAPAQR